MTIKLKFYFSFNSLCTYTAPEWKQCVYLCVCVCVVHPHVLVSTECPAAGLLPDLE